MYRTLRKYFVSVSGSNITQKMIKVCSVARYDLSDKGAVRATETLREARRGQKVDCPDIFYVSIFLASLEPDSVIRQRLDMLVSNQGAKVRLDEVIQIYQTWYRDQEFRNLLSYLSSVPRRLASRRGI